MKELATFFYPALICTFVAAIAFCIPLYVIFIAFLISEDSVS